MKRNPPHFWVVWALLLALSFHLGSRMLEANENEWTLKPQTVVWNERIQFRDLVEETEQLPIDLGEVLIGAAPKPGQSETFTLIEIEHKLKSNRLTGVKVNGPQQIVVHRRGTELEPAHFSAEITAYIRARLPRSERLGIEVTSSQSIVAPQNLDWRLFPAKGQDFLGTMLFSLEGIDPATGQIVLQRWLNVKVHREAQVAVSNRSLNAGTVIGEGDIRYEWRSLSPSILQAHTQENPPTGHQTARALPANQVVTPAFLKQAFMVQRGVIATLTARANGVTASAPVQVLENGRLDQWVLIQNLRSNKSFRARVSGKNRLEVIVQ